LEIGWGLISKVATPYERDLHAYGTGRIGLHALRTAWDDKLVDDDESADVVDSATQLPVVCPSTSSTGSAVPLQSEHCRLWCSHPCTLLYALVHAKKADLSLSREHLSTPPAQVIPPSSEATILTPTYCNFMHLQGHVAPYPRDLHSSLQRRKGSSRSVISRVDEPG
jgi:hypothetical protein